MIVLLCKIEFHICYCRNPADKVVSVLKNFLCCVYIIKLPFHGIYRNLEFQTQISRRTSFPVKKSSTYFTDYNTLSLSEVTENAKEFLMYRQLWSRNGMFPRGVSRKTLVAKAWLLKSGLQKNEGCPFLQISSKNE